MYELSLKGRGIGVEREITEPVALQILSVLMGQEQPIPSRRASGMQPARPVDAARPGRSLREFLNEVEASRNVDKIVAIAAYLESERGYETFSSTQIKGEFRSAREPTPANFPRDFRAAIGAGWLAPSHDDPNEYYVTDSGRRAVEAQFSAEVKRTARSDRPGRRRRSRGQGDEA
jgi:hypothetical protein